MNEIKSVSRETWIQQRRELLCEEKAVLQQLDEVSKKRRELPHVRVDKRYEFETEDGVMNLSQLFGKHSQLIVYHFMFGPDWEEGCLGCSFVCDHFDGANLHLAHHDVSLVAVSRAPLRRLIPFKKRMGWKFPWVSSYESEFNSDFGVTFTPEEISNGQAYYNYQQTSQAHEEMQGLSVFRKDAKGDVHHTYSTYARGLDLLIGTHNLLDLTPKGRNEQGTMNWVRLHDQYGDQDAAKFPTQEPSLRSEVESNECCSHGGDAE